MSIFIPNSPVLFLFFCLALFCTIHFSRLVVLYNLRQADWDGAFNFTGKDEFLSNCIKNSKGVDISHRICTAAEIKHYFSKYGEMALHHSTYLKPNVNCNLSNWESGCEPGWGCSINSQDKIDLKSSRIPARTTDCQPCCEGFFCPEGITCMIRKYGSTGLLLILVQHSFLSVSI